MDNEIRERLERIKAHCKKHFSAEIDCRDCKIGAKLCNEIFELSGFITFPKTWTRQEMDAIVELVERSRNAEKH